MSIIPLFSTSEFGIKGDFNNEHFRRLPNQAPQTFRKHYQLITPAPRRLAPARQAPGCNEPWRSRVRYGRGAIRREMMDYSPLRGRRSFVFIHLIGSFCIPGGSGDTRSIIGGPEVRFVPNLGGNLSKKPALFQKLSTT